MIKPREIKYYTQKLQCPKCKSFNCSLVEELIHLHKTPTKKNGWLSKRRYRLAIIGTNCFHYECEDCGYGHPIPDDNNDDFIIEEKEIYYD